MRPFFSIRNSPRAISVQFSLSVRARVAITLTTSLAVVSVPKSTDISESIRLAEPKGARLVIQQSFLEQYA